MLDLFKSSLSLFAIFVVISVVTVSLFYFFDRFIEKIDRRNPKLAMVFMFLSFPIRIIFGIACIASFFLFWVTAPILISLILVIGGAGGGICLLVKYIWKKRKSADN
jgi:hypothetical protein